MRKRYCIRAAALGLGLAALTSVALAAGTPRHWDVLQQYCVDCHNTTDWAGNLNLDGVTPGDVTTDVAAWEKVIRKLQTGMMPPPGKPRPGRETLEDFARTLATRIDAASAGRPQPGGKSLHRLNRTEYRNAVRDVLGYEPGAELQLPKDDSAEGFDNLADVLAVSPTLVQAYIAAAQKIGRAAVGDLKMPASLAKYAGPDASGQDAHVDGLPLGSHGGMRVAHYFPLDAEYEIKVSISGGFLLGGAPSSLPPKIDLLLDGKPLTVGSARKFRIRVPAGPRVLGVSLVEQRQAAGVEELYARAPARRNSVESVTIEGPFDATAAGDTPSRQRIFSCRPAAPAEETALRAPDPDAPGRPRLSPADDRERHGPRHADELLRRRAQRRRLRDRHPAGDRPRAGRSAVPVPHGGRSQRPRRGQALAHQRRRAREPAVVLPVEQHSRRRADGRCRARPPARAEGARTPGAPHARRSAFRRAGRQLRWPVARRAPAREREAARPRLRRRAARRDGHRDAHVLRPHQAGRSQRARDPRRAADVPERAPRASLRHRRRPRLVHAHRRPCRKTRRAAACWARAACSR